MERKTSSKMLVFGNLKFSVYSRVDKFIIKMSVYEIEEQWECETHEYVGKYIGVQGINELEKLLKDCIRFKGRRW